MPVVRINPVNRLWSAGVSSNNGELDVTLTAQEGGVSLDGYGVANAMTYDGITPADAEGTSGATR